MQKCINDWIIFPSSSPELDSFSMSRKRMEACVPVLIIEGLTRLPSRTITPCPSWILLLSYFKGPPSSWNDIMVTLITWSAFERGWKPLKSPLDTLDISLCCLDLLMHILYLKTLWTMFYDQPSHQPLCLHLFRQYSDLLQNWDQGHSVRVKGVGPHSAKSVLYSCRKMWGSCHLPTPIWFGKLC